MSDRILTEDIFKLPLQTLEKPVDLVTNSCNSLEVENKLHECGLINFSVYRIQARFGYPGQSRNFLRYRSGQHIGKPRHYLL